MPSVPVRAAPARAGLLLAVALVAGCTTDPGPAATPAPAATSAPVATVTTAAAVATTAPPDAPTPAIAPSGAFGTDRVTLTDGSRRVPVSVLVADTPDLRARGLMGRRSLGDGQGMLFLYTDDHTGVFWMRDTLIPLSIAFADADGVIHTIRDMEPCTVSPCERYGAEAAYRTALEVPQGWFDERGITTGWHLER